LATQSFKRGEYVLGVNVRDNVTPEVSEKSRVRVEEAERAIAEGFEYSSRESVIALKLPLLVLAN
jgi:hypothetical protein